MNGKASSSHFKVPDTSTTSVERFHTLLTRLDQSGDARELVQNEEEYLRQRSELLCDVAPKFHSTAELTTAEINALIRDFKLGNASAKQYHPILDPEPDQWKYWNLIKTLPSTVRQMIEPVLGTTRGRNFFGWNFERFKCADVEHGVERVAIATRFEAIDGVQIVYPVHTHIDVPFACLYHALPTDELTQAQCQSHDSIELGRNLVYHPERDICLDEVDVDLLHSEFAEECFGKLMAISILSLTESSLTECELEIAPELLKNFKQQITPLMHRGLTRFPHQIAQVSKIHSADPLVFGGLALQLVFLCEQLHQLAGELGLPQLTALANRLPVVETADRISDIVTVDGDLEWFKGDLAFAGYKIRAYICRLLNMHQKLVYIVENISSDFRSEVLTALDAYLALVIVKFRQVEEQLQASNSPIISADGLLEYYRNIYLPGQQAAEIALNQFLQAKVGSIAHIAAEISTN